MGAQEWREFWRIRGMQELRTLAGAPVAAREACAFRIAAWFAEAAHA